MVVVNDEILTCSDDNSVAVQTAYSLLLAILPLHVVTNRFIHTIFKFNYLIFFFFQCPVIMTIIPIITPKTAKTYEFVIIKQFLCRSINILF
jgi:hypothetical protein